MAEPAQGGAQVPDLLALPTETEIYLLPDGRVLVADLPMELADLAAALGALEPCEVAPASASLPMHPSGPAAAAVGEDCAP